MPNINSSFAVCNFCLAQFVEGNTQHQQNLICKQHKFIMQFQQIHQKLLSGC